MEEVDNLPIPEHEETFEELESSLLILCKSDDEQINDNSLNCNNPELSHTSDLYSKITDIVNNFSNQNFSFPDYYVKVDQQYRLGMLLNDNTLKEDTEYPLCSMVKNEDIAEYFSNCSKNNEEINPTKIKFPEQIDKRNKFLESEDESNSNEKSNISTSTDVFINSLAKQEENETFEEHSYDLMENSTDEVAMGCQSSTENDVGNPCCISILAPTSDSLINSDEELYVEGNDIDTNESENSLTDNCENELKLHIDKINDHVNVPEYIMIDIYDYEELESNSGKNNNILESKNKLTHNEISVKYQNSTKNNVESSSVSLVVSPISDYSINSNEKLHLDKNSISKTKLESKIMNNYQTEEIKSYPHRNNDYVTEPENKMIDSNENELKSYIDDKKDVNESAKIIDNYENEEIKLNHDRNNNDISESENKITNNDENEIKSHHDVSDISELENKIMDNYENEVKSHTDKNKDGISNLGNENIDNYENGEIKAHPDENNEVIESENKISDEENKVNSYLVKNNDESNSKKEIEENYEYSEMSDENQSDLLNRTITVNDDEKDIDSMDFIILDSTDTSVDKEVEFNMKSEKINENDVFDGEKENVCLQSNIKQNNSEDESDCLIVTIDDTDTFSEQSESEVETKTNRIFNKTSPKQNMSSKKQKVTKISCKRPIRINRKWKNSDKVLSEKSLPAKKIETKIEASPNLITSTNAPKENIRQKEIETEIKESSNNTKIKKPKYIIDDPLEIKDINDPEWENVKSLTTDEERYSAVKNCWSSKNIPNPHKDLTRHNFRLKRLKKEGIKPEIIKRKRTATTEPEKLVDPKRQKIESFSCTEILDQRINKEKKLYRQKVNEKERIYLNGLQKINNEAERDRERLRAIYRQRFANTYQAGPLSYQFAYSADLELWRDYNERIIRERESIEKQSAKIRLANENKIIVNKYQQTINKLYRAREEVLKFNQFYCGLNNLNPVVLDEKRMREARKTEEMYEIYKQVYAA